MEFVWFNKQGHYSRYINFVWWIFCIFHYFMDGPDLMDLLIIV